MQMRRQLLTVLGLYVSLNPGFVENLPKILSFCKTERMAHAGQKDSDQHKTDAAEFA